MEEELFDLNAIEEELDAEEIQDEGTNVETEDETPPAEPEKADPQEGEDSEPEESKEDVKPPDDEQKRNRAFAELRRRAEENERYAAFVKKLAEETGLEPEALIKRIEERQLQMQAQQQNVPVDVLKRLKALEEENRMIRETTAAQRMDEQIKNVINTYKASDEEIQNTFAYMLRNGVDPRENPMVNFEDFYRAANFDKIIERKIKEAEQSVLSKKKERQMKASVAHEGGTALTEDIDELIDKEVAAILENW